MNQEILQRAILWQTLVNLGSTAKLKFNINTSNVEKELENYKDKWCPYNQKKDNFNNRYGLPITSHTGDILDNYHLNSFGYMQKYHDVEMKENNFITPTELYYKIPDIANIVNNFMPDIGRVHLLKIDQGGFFPPHRDFHTISPEYFRLLCVFGKCEPENFVHMLDGKPFYPSKGFLYFVNFQLDHSVFSFSDSVLALILTVKLTEKNVETILNNTVAE